MSKKICTVCMGSGMSRGMGYVPENCYSCDSKGFIVMEDNLNAISTEVTGKTEVKIRKKRTVTKIEE